MQEDKLPHERRDNETPSAYEAFLIYLENDPRSLRLVSEEIARRKHGEGSEQFEKAIKRKKPTREVEKWSVKYDWVNRVALYAEYLQKELTQKRIERINRTRDDNFNIAQTIKRQGLTALVRQGKILNALADEGKTKDDELIVELISKVLFNPNQITAMIKDGIFLERQALSLPNYEEIELKKAIKNIEDDNLDKEEEIEIDGLNDDEIEEYDNLLNRLSELNGKAKKKID